MLAPYGMPLRCVPLRLDAGDVVLFSCSMLQSHGTKLATWSQWDHVAMVVRASYSNESCEPRDPSLAPSSSIINEDGSDSNNKASNLSISKSEGAIYLPRSRVKLKLFEATAGGVTLTSLESALSNYREVAKIGIRRLQVERTPELLWALSTFVSEVNGRKYKSDLGQLFRAAYGHNDTDDLSTVFCSQLIAAAFQRIHILSDDDPSNNFLPSDFAHDLRGKLLINKLRPLVTIPRSLGNDIAPLPISSAPPGAIKYSFARLIEDVRLYGHAFRTDATGKSFMVYLIEAIDSDERKWVVTRSYAEFQQLDAELRKHFQGVYPLPQFTKQLVRYEQKQEEGSSSVQSVVRKHMRSLEDYLQKLLKSCIAQTRVLADFLASPGPTRPQDKSGVPTRVTTSDWVSHSPQGMNTSSPKVLLGSRSTDLMLAVKEKAEENKQRKKHKKKKKRTPRTESTTSSADAESTHNADEKTEENQTTQQHADGSDSSKEPRTHHHHHHRNKERKKGEKREKKHKSEKKHRKERGEKAEKREGEGQEEVVEDQAGETNKNAEGVVVCVEEREANRENE
eukprot:TRINITY_DN3331_c0_g2_i2.p1 TRINITY_DN3331_c0_g2~~TRINITY_DN3331_c0_g2_i2.p1  ORF type:complete len:566 (+),score=104.96 TRINITY_DN3331_c0_g2_i2:342-2039(+)